MIFFCKEGEMTLPCTIHVHIHTKFGQFGQLKDNAKRIMDT